MDEFFDKLKDGAYKAKGGAERIAKEVAKRTSNAITYTKLTFAVNEAQKKVNDVYTEIGKNMYEKYLEGEGYDDTFTASFEQIDRLMDEISALNEKTAELKNTLKCPECGASNPAEADYCIKCGSHLSHETDDDYEDDIDSAYEEAESLADDDDEDDDDDVIIINAKKPE
ncbi:MAG TPA: zinc ribbon domain-containing protein [Candidatus Ornithomonoglobus merdipullorum]|uniref:Zinc ribbon domain-containing protein n=1 Tax=Candidatus Ornithomonoglobus merdipullorum TaxID=2840895 RepID=A0A9D1SEK1_9FIRM|nr:zinc ribbon domain-containing protein [Candidatus Ornithomonoglobus merdipullorum]